MRICIVAPLATQDLVHLLDEGGADLPTGYLGAPLMAVLIAELIQLGHEVHAVTVDYALPPGSAPVRARGRGLTFTIVPGRQHAWRWSAGVWGRVWDLFGQERRGIVEAIRSLPADVVHAHWTYEFALAALACQTPHVITAHDVPAVVWRHELSLYRLVRCVMARRALGRAQSVTAVSAYVAQHLSAWCRVPVQALPNPVAPLALELGRDRARPARGELAMVCNGWSARKNVKAALQAFARLRRRRPDVTLHLYGLGFEPGGEAQRRARRTGVDLAGVHWHGPCSHAALLQALTAHDLLLHPSLEESFGMVVAEALALGLPVVGGARSGAVPVVAGPGQWLVDVRSPEALAAAVLDALDDAGRYAEASRAARHRATTLFAAEPIVRAYEAIYRQVRETQACARRP